MLVTTAIHSIANACSSGNGHVYMMSTLDKKYSRKLFLREASWGDYPPGSETVLSTKCDGLPLALVSTAQFLKSKGQQLPQEYAKLCGNLGMHLEREDTLERMKHVLVHNYTSLPGHVIKACLLYFGIFPSGHPVRRGKLIRRWSAEGLVEADPLRSSLDVATDYFNELINRSIIQPVATSSNTEVKTCQTHGMMLEFILHKSMCDDFITLLYDQACLPDKIRCLTVQHNSTRRGRMNSDIDLSHVRSLTIFGEAEDSVLEFSSYELLRVLDLEECENLKDEHLRKICKLLLLRYLSLGGTVTMLPKEITKLKFLETLDVRRTKIKVLPIQVIKLPCLTHLFGNFKLQDVGQKISKLQKYLSEKSKLETLAGFFANNDQGFPQLIDHMKNLAKVKIWCESETPSNSSSNTVHLSKAIQVFIQRGTNMNDVRSLSLNFGGCFQDQENMLKFSLEDSCYLSSLKLKGKINILPPFVTLLKGLTELCLSSSDKLNRDVLAALSNVRCLHYLKLITPNLEKFVIGQGPLKSLRRLCIMVQTMTEPEIQQGALPNLESFRLLCKDLNGLCGINIQYIGPECLKEVALDKKISEETKKKWKETVKNHPRWPKVSFVNTGEVGQMQNMEVAQPTEDAAALALAAGSLRPVPVFRRPKADQERTLDLCSMGQTSRESCSNTEPYFKTNGTSPGKLNPVNDECHHFC